MGDTDNPTRLQRSTFRTSRFLDFASEKELTAQTGHPPAEWPLVIVKELVDNALDACEEAGIAPQISVRVGTHGITVIDNGPGLPAKVAAMLLEAMSAGSRLVKAAQLGIIGPAHLGRLFRAMGCDMDTFQYKRVIAEGSLPWVLEAAFGYCPDDESYDEARVLVTGVNWSPGIGNPFKRIGNDAVAEMTQTRPKWDGHGD